jgi:rod shape-determining protein MreC
MPSRRIRITIATLIVASLTFVILDLRGGEGPLSSARAAASAVIGVIQQGANAVTSPFTGAGSSFSTWRDQANQIAELEEENARLTEELRSTLSDRARARALDDLLRVASAGRYRITPAEVISVGPAQDFAWTVGIDAGSLDGIEKDMTVINGDGLVGRVLKVNPTTSTVVLLVDASSAVGGRVATTEEIGIVSGTGRQDSLDFQLLDPLAELVIGDALVTFGSRGGRPYAPGIPIGEIVDITGTAGQLARVATVLPYANVSQLSVVGVIVRPPREDPRDSVLPPRVSDETAVQDTNGRDAGVDNNDATDEGAAADDQNDPPVEEPVDDGAETTEN